MDSAGREEDASKTLNRHYEDWYIKKPGRKYYHSIFTPEFKPENPSFYCVYKRKRFVMFSEYFPEFIRNDSELEGEGESVNEEVIELAMKTGCEYIMILRRDISVQFFSTLAWKRFSEKNGLIRTQHGGERTYCIPEKILYDLEI